MGFENRPLYLHAVKPGNLVYSYRRSIRIVPIDYQSKRRDMCTAAQRGRRDVVVVVVVSWKNFTGRVSPNENSTQLLLQLLRLYVYSNWSFKVRHSLPPASPFPPVRRTATSTRHLHLHSTAIERTVYAPGSLWWASHSPSYPNSLDLPRYSVFLYIFGWGYAQGT